MGIQRPPALLAQQAYLYLGYVDFQGSQYSQQRYLHSLESFVTKYPLANMPDSAAKSADGLQISAIEDELDFVGVFECSAKAFAEQINDGIWTAINPGWDTPKGKAAGVARFAQRWRSVTKDKHGRPNTVFLKATLADPDRPGQRRIVGTAIWAQLSMVQGHGEQPSTKLGTPEDLKGIYEGDEALQRVACQVWASLMDPRVAVVKAKESADPPATFVLDLCAVDPDFWRRGIAQRLVQWGLDEAQRRGGLESTTEASVMGRHVYQKLGFKPVAEIDYEVDQELLHGRTLPSNLFMRTAQ